MVKNPPVNAGDTGDVVQPRIWEDPLEEEMATHSSIPPGKLHGQRSLLGNSSQGLKESNTTERPNNTVVLRTFTLLCHPFLELPYLANLSPCT